MHKWRFVEKLTVLIEPFMRIVFKVHTYYTRTHKNSTGPCADKQNEQVPRSRALLVLEIFDFKRFVFSNLDVLLKLRRKLNYVTKSETYINETIC